MHLVNVILDANTKPFMPQINTSSTLTCSVAALDAMYCMQMQSGCAACACLVLQASCNSCISILCHMVVMSRSSTAVDAKCALSLQVTISGAPATTSQHFASPLEVESPPAELDADAAADTSTSSSPSTSLNSIHSAFLSKLPSPVDVAKVLTTMGSPAGSPKATPLVNGSQRPALANLTNRLTPQVTLFSNCCALATHCIA